MGIGPRTRSGGDRERIIDAVGNSRGSSVHQSLPQMKNRKQRRKRHLQRSLKARPGLKRRLKSLSWNLKEVNPKDQGNVQSSLSFEMKRKQGNCGLTKGEEIKLAT